MLFDDVVPALRGSLSDGEKLVCMRGALPSSPAEDSWLTCRDGTSLGVLPLPPVRSAENEPSGLLSRRLRLRLIQSQTPNPIRRPSPSTMPTTMPATLPALTPEPPDVEDCPSVASAVGVITTVRT